jgi:hypothetical protein
MRLRWLIVHSPLLLPLAAPPGAGAQTSARVNIYRFVLGVDVPESPALIALDRTPTRVLRGSGPKPIAATATRIFSSGVGQNAIGVDIVPYYLVGGGARSLSSYRSNSIAGRLGRVGTKTQLGIGSLWDESGAALVSVGLRATFHDPHDPVLNSSLPEAVDSALRGAASPPLTDEDERVTDRGADLRPLFDRARRGMRARHGIQISGGWAVAARAGGGVLSGDSLGPARHVVWLSGQITLTPRLDLIGMGQLRAVRGARGSARLGAGIERKAHDADFRAELYYQSVVDQLNGGVSAELRPLRRISIVGSVASEHDVGLLDDRQLRAYLSLRWFTAEDP